MPLDHGPMKLSPHNEKFTNLFIREVLIGLMRIYNHTAKTVGVDVKAA
jgi:hypothetical protein